MPGSPAPPCPTPGWYHNSDAPGGAPADMQTHRTDLSIAGLRLALETEAPPADLGVDERYGAFLAAGDGEPDIRVACRFGEPAAPEGKPDYTAEDIWSMYAGADGSWTAVITYPSPDGAPRPPALLSIDAEWSNAVLTEKRAPGPWRSVITAGAAELLIRTRLVLHDGLVMHGAALQVGEAAVILTGHSGAGKSTQAMIWQEAVGARPLCDDRAAIRPDAGRWLVYGTPWAGTAGIAVNACAPLAAIIVLEQHTENEMTPLSAAEALPMLLARSFLPYWDAALVGTAMGSALSILQGVPVYRLRCRPEAAAADMACARLGLR